MSGVRASQTGYCSIIIQTYPLNCFPFSPTVEHGRHATTVLGCQIPMIVSIGVRGVNPLCIVNFPSPTPALERVESSANHQLCPLLHRFVRVFSLLPIKNIFVIDNFSTF